MELEAPASKADQRWVFVINNARDKDDNGKKRRRKSSSKSSIECRQG